MIIAIFVFDSDIYPPILGKVIYQMKAKMQDYLMIYFVY